MSIQARLWCSARKGISLVAALVSLSIAPDVLAQAVCGCTDLPSASCNCPGCDAFFNASPGSRPHVVPTPVGPVITSPMIEAPSDPYGQPSVPTPADPYAAPPTTLPDAGPAPVIPSTPDPSITAPPVSTAPDTSFLQSAPPMNSFASSLGATSAGQGVPGMIGDFFGSGFNYLAFPDAVGATNVATGQDATVAIAGGDRQLKYAENNSPFPRDRFFFNYHRFEDAVNGAVGSGSVDRYVFGLEKTFLQGLASFEVRAPLVRSVTSTPSVFDTRNQFETEFGNLSLAVKGLLYREANFAASAGLAVVLPTGDDFVVQDTTPNIFENNAVHIQPFLGIYNAPTRRLFTQFFAQLNFDAGESRVLLNGIEDDLSQQTLLMLDYSVGYWLIQNRCGLVRSVAPMVELHYTTTLEDQGYGAFQGDEVFVEDFRRDVLNITGGLFTQIGSMSSLTVGAAAPLRDGSDKLFDYELGVQFVRNF